ncbi:class I SAM-dependent methyltransferase [Streptomyces sp. NBC_01795]|uniref:class I SAM-dependent methyltransferase n=1 Tax=Streptomyces sp. NBC_01795 TaxID=2975943 RepID=UPI002DD8F306|nr:class I SAM-dependent methyltransferase [Streptomyces sp. NBC_01795]WSA93425.1 class I SAM-dependent methyltransferase [Streptomyces sp. NBC_01795]
MTTPARESSSDSEPSSDRAHSFNKAAAQYAAARPPYPAALFDAVEELAGRPLAGARTADVGAGTGIATAVLRERGAAVLAIEPGDGMAAQFRVTLPDVPVVRGDGNALPLADASHDLLTYAQSWHWTDTERSVPEARRVLRPGGALAIWWNTSALDVPWIFAQHERVARATGGKPPSADRPADSVAVRLVGLSDRPDFDVTRRRIRWSRTVPLDLHLANIGSHSAFLVLGEERTRAFLDSERAHLREALAETGSDEWVEEAYVVDLLVAVAR